ncbi:MAG: hypothetical protein RIR26_1116 [Pseudomonadota bacterium]|jgi:mono/diheme cytochrome c family protein
MNAPEQKTASLSRSKVFGVGALVTTVLCGLVLLCVPKKPELIADAPQLQAVSAAVATAAPSGPALYGRFCSSCHGNDGRAQTTMAGMMNPQPTNFVVGPWKGPQTTEAVVSVVKNGKGAMPAYGKEISDESDLKALADYVLSLRKEVTR